jgi:hypothetical protein
MGTPVDRRYMTGSDSTFPAFPKKGEGAASDPPGNPEGTVLPWLMTMPEPSEAMKIGSRSIETRPPSGNHISAEAAVTPLVAEHENGNSRPAPGSLREESQDESCGRDESPLRLPTGVTPVPALTLKEEIASIGARPNEKRHPAEPYFVSEVAGTRTITEHENGNSCSAPGSSPEKFERDFGACDERHLPHVTEVTPMPAPRPKEEIANVAQANQLERDWILAASAVPNAEPFAAGVYGPAQSALATAATTRGSKKGGRVILVASIFTASALCLWSIVRPTPDLPHGAEMASSAASVSSKQEPVRTRAQEAEKSSGRSETSSQPVLPSQSESSFESETLTIAQPTANAAQDGSTHAAPAGPAEQKKASGVPSFASASSEKSSRPQEESQPVGGRLEWRTFEVPEFGTRVQFPANIFAPAGQPERGSGQQFKRADGRAILSIYSRPNATGESPATYLKQNLRVDRSALDYHRIGRSFFAISSERDGVILYSRCNFSGRGHRAIHCFDLRYPQEEKRSWDAIVTRISLSLRPLG